MTRATTSSLVQTTSWRALHPCSFYRLQYAPATIRILMDIVSLRLQGEEGSPC
ncbi:integrase [Sesbania bispinosa]|nr:integrase [Sesbania bispinosa]